MGEPTGRPGEPGEEGSDRFVEIVVRFEPGLRRLIRRICGRRADVDDLVQETYLRAWRGFGQFRGRSSTTTWLTRIAINVSRNWRRSRRATVPLPAWKNSTPALGEAAVTVAYEQALARLPADQRKVFLLHEAEGLTYQQISAALNCPLGTVMSRLHRARARLLEELGDRIEELAP